MPTMTVYVYSVFARKLKDHHIQPNVEAAHVCGIYKENITDISNSYVSMRYITDSSLHRYLYSGIYLFHTQLI